MLKNWCISVSHLSSSATVESTSGSVVIWKNSAWGNSSYTTSPAYHMIAEKVNRYQALEFSEGHPIQIEVAAMTRTGNQALARSFLQFMISPAFQDIIPENNWMMPAAATSQKLNPAFDTLVHPARTLVIPATEAAQKRKAWIDEWLAAMSKS